MEYRTCHHPQALPLWHHGRMFLVPTKNWEWICTLNQEKYQVPLCSVQEKNALLQSAQENLFQLVQLSFENKKNLIQNFFNDLKKYQTHLSGLLPHNLNEKEWQNTFDFLENCLKQENNENNDQNKHEQKIILLMPSLENPLLDFIQNFIFHFFKNNAVILKPHLKFSAFFLALAELTNLFPQDALQVLLGEDFLLKE